MLWIPIWAAGFINGVGHWFGYRNGETRDQSRNILPVGIIVGGEELHNNHHLDPASARLSRRWFELDIGYIWLKLFSLLGLAKIK
jgi:fatty-acid desaturase